MHLRTWGAAGPTLVLVHGSILGGRATWRAFRGLADRNRLLVPTRRGYAPGPPLEPGAVEDHERDAADLVELLSGPLVDEPVHLVGHSFGAVVALLAAAAAPSRVGSLTLLEPPPLPPVHERPAVREWVGGLEALQGRADLADGAWLRAFAQLVGAEIEVDEPLPRETARHVGLARSARPVWRAEVDYRAVAAAGMVATVVSGGHAEAFETGCDDVAERLGAERLVVPGAGHNVPWAPGAAEAVEKLSHAR
ncbi:alpha/beta fold hydrolase [Pseudonocardia lutea]|uniref:Alpha/beta fold hydrolase n=1 Tax=Pseudonocardia lutea TaxID=2172015 RepID=A0ABW1IDQ9_9PSEU